MKSLIRIEIDLLLVRHPLGRIGVCVWERLCVKQSGWCFFFFYSPFVYCQAEREGSTEPRILRRRVRIESGGVVAGRGGGQLLDAGGIPAPGARPQEASRGAQGERGHPVRVRRPQRRPWWNRSWNGSFFFFVLFSFCFVFFTRSLSPLFQSSNRHPPWKGGGAKEGGANGGGARGGRIFKSIELLFIYGMEWFVFVRSLSPLFQSSNHNPPLKGRGRG